jgi:SPP1 family predicted phage head-tail adaptor
MRAGRRNKRVELQSKAFTDDGMGGGTEAWTTYATVWAAPKPLRGAERYAAQQIEASEEGVWEILYRSGVLPKHRVKYGSRVFEITAVINPFERNHTLELHYAEVPA